MNIFCLSPFVKQQFTQTPELHDLLIDEFDLLTDWQNYQQNNSQLDGFSILRKYRQSRLALIAARDLINDRIKGQAQNHLHTLKQTSQLAKLLITFAHDVALRECIKKFGTLINSNSMEQHLIIFALGKLGGDELNYSSDVDLVFCYTGQGNSNGYKSLDAQSYFNHMGRRIIQLLDFATADGIVYRVDMRLRPFGSAAPLVCSLNHLLNYFETEGRDWERYAWLRASFVAGGFEKAQQTLEEIQPFIYRKYLDYSIFQSLRQIKAQIIRKQLNDEDNLKLGRGGIREIEFIVQTLQLTFAGRNKQLRGNDLWQQMHSLTDFGHLSVKELQQLTVAWLFLRKLENMCQIISDQDVHHLPQNKQALALCMNCQNQQELLKQLAEHQNSVHGIFEKLFLSNRTTNQNNQKPQQTNSKIQAIKDAISNKNYPKANKHKIYAAFDAIVPFLEKYKNTGEIIDRYQQIIDAVSKRLSYLSMLIESPLILEKLLTQISHSHYFSNTIATTPSLLELLFDGLEKSDFDISKQWQLFSKKHSTSDDEQYLELLCQFKQQIQFKAVMAYVDELHDATETTAHLTQLAEYILSLVAQQAWQQTQSHTQCNIKSNDLIIVAYGSLAVGNMHLNSDFDLVFILNQDITDNNHKFIMRWIKRIMHLLSVQTYFGSLYQLDTQLRPNGNSGTAIVTQNSFEDYQLKEAWLWEHAALIKSRAVYATKTQNKWFRNIRKSVICQKRNLKTVDMELGKMTKSLKQKNYKNHQKEFKVLGNILKKANGDPKIIDNYLINLSETKTRLEKSILKASHLAFQYL